MLLVLKFVMKHSLDHWPSLGAGIGNDCSIGPLENRKYCERLNSFLHSSNYNFMHANKQKFRVSTTSSCLR